MECPQSMLTTYNSARLGGIGFCAAFYTIIHNRLCFRMESHIMPRPLVVSMRWSDDSTKRKSDRDKELGKDGGDRAAMRKCRGAERNRTRVLVWVIRMVEKH